MDTAAGTTTPGDAGDRETLVLGTIDVAVIIAFVTAGQLSHGADPISAPIASIETVTPFLLGWLVIAPLASLYAIPGTAVARVARVTAVTWIAAANVGLILRTSPLFDGGATWPFGLVITATGLVVLLAWRVGYAVLSSRS